MRGVSRLESELASDFFSVFQIMIPLVPSAEVVIKEERTNISTRNDGVFFFKTGFGRVERI